MSKHLKNHQLNLIRTNKKLKFYSIFKNETNHPEFINHIRNPEHKRVASKFRIGNHNLQICDHCNQNSVENELHILFHCDQYNDLRKTLFIKINDRNTLFTNYNILVSFAAVTCVAWRFWLGALSNKGGRGQRNGEEIGAEATSPLVLARFAREFRGYAAPAPGLTKPPCYAGYRSRY